MNTQVSTIKPKPTRRKFLKMAVGMAIFGVGADAAAVEPRNIEITKHDVLMEKLPKALDGLRIVQLSDLHRRRLVPDSIIESAVEQANSLSPDLVVVTGDFIGHGHHNVGPCADMLVKLKTRFGVYGVIGNHDIWTGAAEVIRGLEERGIQVLRNSNHQPVPGLTLLGLDDYWVGKPNFDKTWEGADPDTAHIFLCHNPGAVKHVSHRDCLMLSGHTHGGQINLPLIPRKFLPGLIGFKYIEGWFTVDKTRLYVNRGIGMVNPPVRLLCPPEVTLFTLRSA